LKVKKKEVTKIFEENANKSQSKAFVLFCLEKALFEEITFLSANEVAQGIILKYNFVVISRLRTIGY